MKKNIAVFVHEALNGVGHTNAMLEVLRRFPLTKGDRIDFVCFEFDSPQELVQIDGVEVNIHQVPFPNIKPFLLKMIWFHIYTWFLTLSKYQNFKRISIGLAAFNCNYINIQFVHEMWEKYYFQASKMPIYKRIYKRLLFTYFRIAENLYYSRSNIKLICLSSFIRDYLKEKYSKSDEDCLLAYSGTNINSYYPLEIERSELFNQLVTSYPQLKDINIDKPIYLFVGAFERKGLPYALNSLEHVDDAQIIIVGKPEAGNQAPSVPANVKAYWVHFTKELNLFYNLADAFLFPTLYEPFGLVIVEAAACGIKVFVTKDEVGASEIFSNQKDIEFIPKMTNFDIKDVRVLSYSERKENRDSRMSVVNQHSWDGASEKWFQAIF
ncbi:MAG: glycosyltransferase family 4 protein [Oligoflexia bacterium]|nr:glycosyltransferase family 4 protein [Oligoflexia bacterium]